jgi:hypothetical protein
VKRASGLLLAPIVCAAVACDSGGEPANAGLSEPFQVSGGQFTPGSLPGTPPPSADAGSEAGATGPGDAGASVLGDPSIAAVNFKNPSVISGLGGFGISGYVTQDAVTVGVRFADMGTGYWTVPVSGVDDMMAGYRDFGLTAGFNPKDPSGRHPMTFVGFDKNGNAGTQFVQSFCLQSRVPDNNHSCFPILAAPKAVFSLTWDTGFDVDLHVLTPDGSDINPKTDLVVGDASALTTSASIAASDHIDRDSWGGCAADGWHEEDLIFQTAPPSGAYNIYANPYASCGQPAVLYTLTIWEVGSDGDLHATYTQSGELLANQVTGGQSTGLYITQKVY